MKHSKPSRQPRLTPEVFDLRAKGWTLQKIANQFGVSKAAVSLYISRPRTRFNTPSIERHCTGCGKPGWYSKEQDPNTAYCSTNCYFESLRDHPYQPNRHGQRLGRKAVTNFYGQIPDESVVHHVDGNCMNNVRQNLVLFASQSDHLKHHRNCSHLPPLWSGIPLVCQHS